MPPVRLDFTPPSQPDIVSLHVDEGPSSTGPFNELVEITNIGTYPDYISYVTVNAVNPNDWFRISWENDGGAISPFSTPIQGGTSTLVQQIVDRVMLRDPTLNETVVTQTAEAVIAYVMQTDDPYDVTLTATYAQLEGMTLLTMARVGISTITTSASGESYSAGLVSQKSSTTSTKSLDTIKYLLSQANALLGVSLTMVMLLEDIDPTGLGTTSGIEEDVSRGIMTEFIG